MARIVRGPFDLLLGDDTLAEVDEVTLNYEVSTNDHESLQGHTYEIEGPHKVSLEVRFLQTDVPSLAVALPQYFVANGEVLSTGETVTDTEGAIDVVPTDCGDTETYDNLIIKACGDNQELLRILSAKSRIGGVEIDGNVRKVTVVWNGFSSAATIQFFRENSIPVVS